MEIHNSRLRPAIIFYSRRAIFRTLLKQKNAIRRWQGLKLAPPFSPIVFLPHVTRLTNMLGTFKSLLLAPLQPTLSSEQEKCSSEFDEFGSVLDQWDINDVDSQESLEDNLDNFNDDIENGLEHFGSFL